MKTVSVMPYRANVDLMKLLAILLKTLKVSNCWLFCVFCLLECLKTVMELTINIYLKILKEITLTGSKIPLCVLRMLL